MPSFNKSGELEEKSNIVFEDPDAEDIITRRSFRRVYSEDKITKNKPRNGDKKKELFHGKNPFRKSSCCGRAFFSWVNPLIIYTRKYKHINIEDLGLLDERD